MKKLFLFLTPALIACNLLFAQKQFNPQIGLSFQDLTKPDSGYSYKPNTGYMVGLDARFGKGFYFQPGLFYVNNVTIIDDGGGNSAKLTTSNLRLKTYVGWNIINGADLKVRINAGISGDYLLSMKDDKDDYDVLDKEDYNDFAINGGIGAGIDFFIFSAELGLVNQLNETFKEKEYTPDSKYISYYLTLGIVFGDGLHKN